MDILFTTTLSVIVHPEALVNIKVYWPLFSIPTFGMIGFSKSLAQEVASRGITVNCIAPGFITSPMTDELNEAQREATLAKIPAARLGTGTEIANGALYLASDEAAYVTGQTLHINGGMAML